MNLAAEIQEQQVSEAFSKQAAGFDELDRSNPILQRMRAKVQSHVLSLLKPGDRILELNAGTGIDAVFFAEHGFDVHATDNADGMIRILNEKVRMENFGHKITVQKCSFTNLESIEGSSFDHIFSNFGGLNCTDDLQKVVDQCNQLLNPGGVVTFVLMSKICLWEFLYLFKGNFKLATRRLSGKGSRSHLEGVYFTTYYYNPSHVAGMFGKKYQRICIKGLGLLSPPPYLPHIASANPRLYKLLCKIEEKIDGYVPFNGWGDHYVISMKKIS